MNRINLKTRIIVALAGALLTACSPQVITEVTMSYPARNADEVRVYNVGDTVPNSAIAIGKVAVLDRGFTSNCGYDRMLGVAKKRSAENGANGLLLTEHLDPSFWGSSCHQLRGTMFLMTDTIIDKTKPNSIMAAVKREAEAKAQAAKDRALPQNSIRLSYGPSWITSHMETPKGTNHPFGWEANLEYEHVWRTGIGFGINTSLYRTSFTEKDNGINGDMTLFYVGPSIVFANKFDKHWRASGAIGVGYAYIDDVLSHQSCVGYFAKLGIEYLLNAHWGIGLDLNVSQNFKKSEGIKLRDNNRLGIERLGLLFGARYYF